MEISVFSTYFIIFVRIPFMIDMMEKAGAFIIQVMFHFPQEKVI